jgi:hypothetical protein
LSANRFGKLHVNALAITLHYPGATAARELRMSNLRLGAINLAPKDVAYVRALVRLFAHTEKLSWSFADAAPYHAVVADPRARAANPGFFAGFGGVVLTLVDAPGTPAVDTVAYPIRANQFRDWLKLRQASLLGALYRAELPGAIATAAAAPADAGRRFRLRRWPQAALLQGDPRALRMATFMSRNALSVAQLAVLTMQPEQACRDFVGVLHDAGLLVELVATAAAGAVAAAPTDKTAIPAPRGLMASLRRRLGLQE